LELWRHFLRRPDGTILELFDNVELPDDEAYKLLEYQLLTTGAPGASMVFGSTAPLYGAPMMPPLGLSINASHDFDDDKSSSGLSLPLRTPVPPGLGSSGMRGVFGRQPSTANNALAIAVMASNNSSSGGGGSGLSLGGSGGGSLYGSGGSMGSRPALPSTPGLGSSGRPLASSGGFLSSSAASSLAATNNIASSSFGSTPTTATTGLMSSLLVGSDNGNTDDDNDDDSNMIGVGAGAAASSVAGRTNTTTPPPSRGRALESFPLGKGRPTPSGFPGLAPVAESKRPSPLTTIHDGDGDDE
jgi:hypothetical protein